jgi:hypothetical protein
MSVTSRVQAMTRDQFFDWAETQDARYEFDGFEPVAMTGGNINHNRIAFNIHRCGGWTYHAHHRSFTPDGGKGSQ